MNKAAENTFDMRDVKGANVTLTDEFLLNAQEKNVEFLLGTKLRGNAPKQKLDPYRFLAHFYTTAGLLRPKEARVYENSWERSRDNNFRGHMFGHYMSAIALSYYYQKDELIRRQLRERMQICVTELTLCQEVFAKKYPERAGYIAPFGDVRLDEIDGLTGGVGISEGTVFVPWYNLHKVLAGLLDIYKYANDCEFADCALNIAKGFGDYFYNVRVKYYTPENKEKMLATEYGGMNDAFYELYNLTGEVKYRICAQTFDEVSLFDELAKGNNPLPGRHANTQVPKFIGALKRYTVLTQNADYYNELSDNEKEELPKYFTAVKNFFDIVLENHTYITGGNSCDEHFHAPNTLAKTINKDATHETCNVHNMLKIARELFKLTGDVKYSDYYENAFINAILSAQNPKTGEMMYFQPMGTGYYKLFRNGLFWCCTGTGVESYAKLADSIYFEQNDNIYVNMYFSSEYENAAQNIKIIQKSTLPGGYDAYFTIKSLDGFEIKSSTVLWLRVPDWCKSSILFKIDEKLRWLDDYEIVNGYVKITDLNENPEIRLVFSKTMKMDVLKDDEQVVAFKWGPLVLSANLGDNDLDKTNPNGIMVLTPPRDKEALDYIVIEDISLDEWKKVVKNGVGVIDFEADKMFMEIFKAQPSAKPLFFTPHYKKYKERYAIYVRMLEANQVEEFELAKNKERETLLETTGASAYLTNFDNHAYEAFYELDEHNTSTGNWPWHSKTFRFGTKSDSWFSYKLPIVKDVANFLNTTLFKEDVGKSWDVCINDVLIHKEKVNNESESLFYTSSVRIPDEFTSGDCMVNNSGVSVACVKFVASDGIVGGIFGISVTQLKEGNDG